MSTCLWIQKFLQMPFYHSTSNHHKNGGEETAAGTKIEAVEWQLIFPVGHKSKVGKVCAQAANFLFLLDTSPNKFQGAPE